MTKRKRARKEHRPPVGAASAVAREAKDLLLKLQAAGLGGGFLAGLGINLPPIVAALPAELPTLEVRVEQPDSLFRLADRAILHFEFQNTKDAGDLRRFYRYQHAVSEYYDTEVHTVVLYGPGISEAPDVLRRGSAVYTVHNVFIGLQDGEAVLTALRSKLSRGETLDEADLAQLKLLPLMGGRRPLQDVLRDAITLAERLPQPEHNTAIGTILGLAYNYVGQEKIDQLLGVGEVANALQKLVEDALLKGQAEGKAEGHAEGQEQGRIIAQREDIISILVSRFGPLPDGMQARIARINAPSRLRTLLLAAAGTDSLDSFAQALEEQDLS
jgi:hypothetical protein